MCMVDVATPTVSDGEAVLCNPTVGVLRVLEMKKLATIRSVCDD